MACTRLGLFELLAESVYSAEELATALELPRTSVERLLQAAESLRLVEARGRNLYGLGPLGAALLGNPAVALMIKHHSAFYADLRDPVALLSGKCQSTELRRFWAYSSNPSPSALAPDDTDGYTELMAASQALIAEQVLSSYPLRGHRHLLDVGGGDGVFAIAAIRQQPQLEARVFDLPSVAQRARARFEHLGLDSRASASGGDFLVDPLPLGYDLISLLRILHDHDDDVALQLLRAVRGAIASTGVLLIAEPMLGTPGAQPAAAAYFGFYLMAMGQGRPRSPDEIKSLLIEAGFTNVKVRNTTAPLLTRVMTATPKDEMVP